MATTYQRKYLRFGVGGLDLRRSVDLVDNLNATVLTNAIRLPDGGWTSRYGQTSLCTGSGVFHSVVRGTDPQSSTTNLFWGTGTDIASGVSGALSTISSGYSGNPLSLVPWESKQSGTAWVVVGDTAQMKKIRVSDGLVLPIGLPEPGSAPTTALAAENKKQIEAFTSAAGYTTTANGGAAVPTLATAVDLPTGGTCLKVSTHKNTATTGYESWIDKGVTLDLTTFGAVAASDDDYIHFWLRMDKPSFVTEVRLYLVTGGVTPGVLPGTSTTDNQNAYYHSFRPSDSTPIVLGAASTAVAPTILSRRLTADGIKEPLTQDETLPATSDTVVTTDLTGQQNTDSSQQSLGNYAWTEWGSVGIPLRRGDFQQIGKPTWAGVTRMFVYILTNAAQDVIVEVGDCYLTGGAGPDTGTPGNTKYDYVYTNYDPRTGAEGNASTSHLQAEASWLDALRRGITITPSAGSDAAWRQRFYRRGGTLTDNWYYVGQNSSNGGTFTDTLSDAQIAAEATAPTDYFAAVPSVDASGTTVLGKPVPYVWGPLQGLIFAAGDTNRPGAVYYPYPDSVDQWSASGYVNVASSTESIQGGFILGSAAFAWGTQRLYALNINLGDAQSVTPTVTNCTRAPVAPWAHTTALGLNWFCAYDGIYATNGGEEINVSDAWVRPLFQNTRANGLAPVDMSATSAIRLAVYQNELHFTYQDIDGVRNSLVYHLQDKVWRHARYAAATAALYTDIYSGVGRLLMGGAAGGRAYTYSGTSDNGTAISVTATTRADDNGYPKSFKRYSDFTLDAACNSVTVTATPLWDYNTAAGTATVATGSGRQPYVASFSDERLSQTFGLQLGWSTAGTPPVVYGVTSTFEVEPATVTRWWSLPTDHGVVGWQLATRMFLTLRSSDAVDLTVVAYGQDGTALSTTTYVIPSTSGAKVKRWVPFNATKGCQYSYILSSATPFTLYAAESFTCVQPWGVDQAVELHLIDMRNEGTESFAAFTPEAAATAGG